MDTSDSPNASPTGAPHAGHGLAAGTTRWYTVAFLSGTEADHALATLQAQGPAAVVQALLDSLDQEVALSRARSAGHIYPALPTGPFDQVSTVGDHALVTNPLGPTLHLLRSYEPPLSAPLSLVSGPDLTIDETPSDVGRLEAAIVDPTILNTAENATGEDSPAALHATAAEVGDPGAGDPGVGVSHAALWNTTRYHDRMRDRRFGRPDPRTDGIRHLQELAGPVWRLLRRLGVDGGQMIALWPEAVALTGVTDPAAYYRPDTDTFWVAPIPPPGQPHAHDPSMVAPGGALHEYGPGDPVSFDVALAVLRYADLRFPDPELRRQLGDLHARTVLDALDHLSPGGILVAVAGHQVLDDPADHDRRALAARADFLGAARLPATAWHPDGFLPDGPWPPSWLAPADLLVLRRRPMGEPDRSAPFITSRAHPVQDGAVLAGEYFGDNPHHVIGLPALDHTTGHRLLTVLPQHHGPLTRDLQDVLDDIAGDAAIRGLPTVTSPSTTNTTGLHGTGTQELAGQSDDGPPGADPPVTGP